jgi:hypothetical protein
MEEVAAHVLRYKLATCLVLGGAVFAASAIGGTISLAGGITQSTLDYSGQAVNNPTLNKILDNDRYAITLNFAGAISSPGTYNLTGSTLLFSDPAAPATESAFALISMTVTPNGSSDDISLLGCLSSGSGCFVGNELTANFRIAAASLNSAGVSATGLDQPHPFDLLEDDGTTDIQGSIDTYSYAGATAAAPEPGSSVLLFVALAAFAIKNRRKSSE